MRISWFAFPLLVLLCVFPLAAAAEQPAAPCAPVLALCAERYPGYMISDWDGGGDEQRGQVALVLSQNGHNILCIAEKAADEAAYTFTVETDTAVRQGADIPDLLIDTGGDVLFYTYRDPDITCTYDTVKGRDGWGTVGITLYRDRGKASDRETHYFYQDHGLVISLYYTDENDNITSSVRYIPIIAPWLADRFALSGFDIALLPDDNLYTPRLLQLYEQSVLAALPEGYAVLQAAPTPYALMAEVQDSGGARTVVVLESPHNNAYRVTQSTPLPEGVCVDLSHSWSGLVVRLYPNPDIQETYNIYGFTRLPNGQWTLRSAMTPDNHSFTYAPFGIDDSGVWHVGSYPVRELTAMDWSALPVTFAQALAALNMADWARVISDDPANNRLHLRAAPDSGAESLGKYYQGTPVQVLGSKGKWTEVDVFGVHGYMMTRWLVFGPDMNNVDNAFTQLSYRGEALEEGIAVYASPGDPAPAVTLASPPDPVILGVVGDEWVHVLLPGTGVTGYIRQADLWEGNG